jgi:hypothetical protein
MRVWSVLVAALLGSVLAIAVAIAMGAHGGDVLSQFGEYRLVTFLSVVQLLIISALSCRIWWARRGMRERPFWRSRSVIWGVIAASFAFLAVDDLLMIHEQADQLIHQILRIEETPLTDRLDDCLVGLYGLVGMAALVIHRDELRAHRKSFPYFAMGFMLMFAMVALDMLTNRDDVLVALFDRAAADMLFVWLSVAEDAAKVLAEVFFIVAFYAIWRQVRPDAVPAYGRAVSR